jgi:hypothetical protein
MFRYIMKVNSENIEDMIFLRLFSENLGGVLYLSSELCQPMVYAGGHESVGGGSGRIMWTCGSCGDVGIYGLKIINQKQ